MSTELDLDDIVDRINEQGLWAYVEQTGGGCATIYAGAWHSVDDDPYSSGSRIAYSAVAGPGSFGWGERPSTGDTCEFYISADTLGDTRSGFQGVDCTDLEITSSNDVANLIVAQARRPLGRSLTQRQARRILQGKRPGLIPEWLKTRRTRCTGHCSCRAWVRR